MRVLVLGAGVIGVTTAWYLNQAGHDVTVVDRLSGPGLETSYANAGQVSPGYSAPWAAPSVPAKAIKWLMMRHAPLILHTRADMAMIRWTLQMLRNCTPARYAVNKGRMVRLAEYARDELDLLRQKTGIQYDGRQQGTLQLFRTEKQLKDAHKDVAVLQSEGVAYELLDADGCRRAEPGLAHSEVPYVGALRLPGDETGDCRIFTETLAQMAEAAGVKFRWNETISAISRDGDKIDGVLTDKDTLTADAYVMALGSWSPQMIRNLDLKLPIYPVKGYSITADILDDAKAPVSTVMDESYKIAITRLGTRIRAGGMAELNGFNRDLVARRRDTLNYSVDSLFPGAGNLKDAEFWCGLRPNTPDGTPIVGASKYTNLWLNTGHGTLGWTMSCGSAAVISDMISGKAPAIKTDDLNLSRYNG
ncbi:D-amino acid dehydrogenase [Brevundimonas terrae]|uniref:D-amino acid dehydrogenase n=1 Tax=Brevundimonas terrae TaxID=363631 RepID=A0ABN0YE47_9CAUL|nr:D-amino acid dehydrogenase [Brevundimonas terrae]NIJ26635.1 D-amino-acid dehydrogenase [Brevundimonas terrae]